MSDTLAGLAKGTARTIVSLDIPPEDAVMLDGIGVSPGREVTVLRRAPFGGPLHVRVDTGVEVAIDRALAEHIALAPVAS